MQQFEGSDLVLMGPDRSVVILDTQRACDTSKAMRFLTEGDLKVIKEWKDTQEKVISEKSREKETSNRE